MFLVEKDVVIETISPLNSTPDITKRYPTRSNRTVQEKPYGREQILYVTNIDLTKIKIPTTYNQVLKSPERQQWLDAIEEEINTLDEMQTFQFPNEFPENRNIVNTKFVFDLKMKADGSIDRFKARLVAQGFTQVPNVDFQDTYAPVERLETFRLQLSYALQNNFIPNHFDIKNAFPHAELEEETYIRIPNGAGYLSNQIVRCVKALYGLKQAANRFYEFLVAKFKSINFIPSIADPCLFIRCENNNTVSLIGTSVDDLLVTAQDPDAIFYELNQMFKIKNLGVIAARSVAGKFK